MLENANAVDELLASDEPAIRYMARVNVLAEDAKSPRCRRLAAEIRSCPRVQKMLSEVDASGTIPLHPYRKWRGAHWVLAHLSEIAYPRNDRRLRPLVEQALDWVLGIEALMIDGRARRCASQQGYALLYLIKLGFYDARCDELARRLISWQWPDGGWNCDRRPKASHSSFHESLLPMRGLFAHAAHAGNAESHRAALRTAEMLLDRHLFRRKTTGEIINPKFVQFHYPYCWPYAILPALKGIGEGGVLGDRRSVEALTLLKSKQLPDGGGWASDRKCYVLSKAAAGSQQSRVSWGPHGTSQMNPWVTADALYVLRMARAVKSRQPAEAV